MSSSILPHHLKVVTWKMNISIIFHDMPWNVLKDFVLLMWAYSPTHPLVSLGTNMPPRMFLKFCRGEPIGWCKHAPNGCFLYFWRVGGLFPIKFPERSHQIPLVPINIPSKYFCSHQVPKQFSSGSSCSHQ
jgi:hypothetical protein